MKIKPIVGIITSETVGFNGRQLSHSAGKRYVNSVMNFSKVVPILIPACIGKNDLRALLARIDGVVLTGGRANIEPQHYGGREFPIDEPIDPDRDKVVLDIIPERIKQLNNKISPLEDSDIENFLKNKQLNLNATLDEELAFEHAEFVIVATPTDFDATKNYFNTSSVETVIKSVQTLIDGNREKN